MSFVSQYLNAFYRQSNSRTVMGNEQIVNSSYTSGLLDCGAKICSSYDN